MTTDIKPKTAELIREIANRHGGELTPEIVLDAARPKESPLHCHFMWHNGEAAEQYRLIQAAGLIRRIKVTFEKSDETTVRIREFVCVQSNGRDVADGDDVPQRGIYISTQTALGIESYKDQIIAECKRDIGSFQRKYAALKEVEKILQAMAEFA